MIRVNYIRYTILTFRTVTLSLSSGTEMMNTTAAAHWKMAVFAGTL